MLLLVSSFKFIFRFNVSGKLIYVVMFFVESVLRD